MKPKDDQRALRSGCAPSRETTSIAFLFELPPSSLSLSFSLALSLSPPTNKKNSATIAWREEYKPDEITFDDIKALNTGRLELSKDRDVDGRPLVFFRLR